MEKFTLPLILSRQGRGEIAALVVSAWPRHLARNDILFVIARKQYVSVAISVSFEHHPVMDVAQPLLAKERKVSLSLRERAES